MVALPGHANFASVNAHIAEQFLRPPNPLRRRNHYFGESEPDATDANFYLGVCELLNAQADESLAHLQIAAKSAPPSLAQQAHFYLAKAYVQTRDLASAEKEMSAAAAIVGQFTASARSDLASVQALRAKENR
ncbi:MAG: hypothetical protein DMG97_15415 [Acidobacteria bacterium]|nr:MAG: hypothetical protein DMG97_15415 [Acidobacteriota bacterium]PYV76823.1 MAG: hypothetical protein DMG96_13040 [Acidobacteriota bacterium]